MSVFNLSESWSNPSQKDSQATPRDVIGSGMEGGAIVSLEVINI